MDLLMGLIEIILAVINIPAMCMVGALMAAVALIIVTLIIW